jgi:NADH:ubiquinone oxidoreductase subunit B-like Fe-S oxidoreductase
MSARGNGAAGGGVNSEDAVTWLSRLAPLKLFVSGCQVRRRHSSSAVLDPESLLDQVDAVDVVGDANMLLPGEKGAGWG